MGGGINWTSKATAVLLGLGCCLTGASCVRGDHSGVGPIDQLLGSKYVIVGTVLTNEDQQVVLEATGVVPLADGLPDQGVSQGDTVEVAVDARLEDLEPGHEYAIFLGWTGEFHPSRFAYDLGASSFVVPGSGGRSHNGNSLEDVVDCLDEQFSVDETGIGRLDALIELVRQEQDTQPDDYPDELTTCAMS